MELETYLVTFSDISKQMPHRAGNVQDMPVFPEKRYLSVDELI